MPQVLNEPGVLLHAPGVRVLLKTLQPGGEIPSHTHPGHDVLVSVLHGHLTLTTPDAVTELNAAHVAKLDAVTPLALKAGPDGATFTVTLARHA